MSSKSDDSLPDPLSICCLILRDLVTTDLLELLVILLALGILTENHHKVSLRKPKVLLIVQEDQWSPDRVKSDSKLIVDQAANHLT
jgi:hypothetical protein